MPLYPRKRNSVPIVQDAGCQYLYFTIRRADEYSTVVGLVHLSGETQTGRGGLTACRRVDPQVSLLAGGQFVGGSTKKNLTNV